MSTEAPHHGQAAAAGKPTTGRNTAEKIAAPIEISTVVANGASPRLMVAFHPAWHAAANSTAAKTNGSIARTILGGCGRAPDDRYPACGTARSLNPGTPPLPTPPARRAGIVWGERPRRRGHAPPANPNGDRRAWRARAPPYRPCLRR